MYIYRHPHPRASNKKKTKVGVKDGATQRIARLEIKIAVQKENISSENPSSTVYHRVMPCNPMEEEWRGQRVAGEYIGWQPCPG